MSQRYEARVEHQARFPRNKPRLSLHQVLSGSERGKTQFFAVIIDPESQKRIHEVLIYEAEPDEVVELCLERLTLLDKEFRRL